MGRRATAGLMDTGSDSRVSQGWEKRPQDTREQAVWMESALSPSPAVWPQVSPPL